MQFKPEDLLLEFGERKAGAPAAPAKKSNSYLRAMGKMLAQMYNEDNEKAKKRKRAVTRP